MSEELRGDELALAHLDLLDIVVWKGHSPSFCDTDDLRQEAFIGLLQAARNYDPAKGSFRTFARFRMKGAIRDWARLFPHPESRPACRKVLVVSESTASRDEWNQGVMSGVPAPWQAAQSEDEVRRILRRLGPRSRHAVRRYHVDGEYQKDIADDLHVTHSRVSQILKEAMRVLRETVSWN